MSDVLAVLLWIFVEVGVNIILPIAVTPRHKAVAVKTAAASDTLLGSHRDTLRLVKADSLSALRADDTLRIKPPDSLKSEPDSLRTK